MAVDDLGDIFERRNSESGTLQAILSWAQDAVSSTDAGIFVARGPGFESVVSTSERVSQADALQQELEEGPALQGILMERLSIDADAAFTFLIRESQHRNVKLRAVADWIVTHRGDRKLSDLDL